MKIMAQDGTKPSLPSPGADELKDVRNMVALFLTAMKNYALYPADHNITQKFMSNVKAGLEVFLAKYGSLRFDVVKDALLYEGQSVHEDRAAAGLAFSLFKDGITWLEFMEGIALDEIVAFFQVLHTYKEQREEAGGDVVTALWDLSLPHLRYEAADVLWDADGTLDLRSLNRGFVYSREMAVAEDVDAPPFEGMAEKFEETQPCLLTAVEEQALRHMVLAEETKETNEGVLDVLIIILQGQCRQEDFETTLSLLRDEFYIVLAHGELESGLNMLENLRVLMMTSQSATPWIVPMLENFFRDVSSLDGMSGICQLLTGLDTSNQERCVLLRKMLSLLDPVAIGSLAPLLVQVSSPVLEQLLHDAIEMLAGRDLLPLEKIFKSADDPVIEKLVPILGRLPGQRAGQTLQKLIRHSSEMVRRSAVRVFLQGAGREIREVFPLIDDHASVIREMAFRFLGREKNAQAERLLMDYLAKSRSITVDVNSLVLAFDALGRCGGLPCLPFLRRVLLGQGWNWFKGFGKPRYRRGAVVALRRLGMPEAEAILARAAGSIFPVVRSAVKDAEV